MSHTSTVSSIKISSIPALRRAITELANQGIAISLIENAKPRAYSSNQSGMGQAPYVVKLDRADYDIGLYLDKDGNYEARTDFFGGTVASVLGATASSPASREQAQMGKLFQMYGICAVEDAARRKGQTVQRKVKTNGTIALEVSGAGL